MVYTKNRKKRRKTSKPHSQKGYWVKMNSAKKSMNEEVEKV